MKNQVVIYSILFLFFIATISVCYSQKTEKHEISTPLYFPANTSNSNEDQADKMNDFMNRWYSKHLRSMKEPIIYLEHNASVYRYTNLGTWSNPFMIRIELKDGKVSLDYKKTNGQGGYDAGVIVKKIHQDLSADVWDKIQMKIDSCKFWKMASYKNMELKDGQKMIIMDGTEWILEGVESNRYHFVTRNTPDVYGDPQYASLCNYIEQLVDKK